jgi:3-hydroxyisobutyrate dehydrogenase
MAIEKAVCTAAERDRQRASGRTKMNTVQDTRSIGFIGLGNLGKAMAERLIHEGVNLTVWNRTQQKSVGVEARWADSPREVTAVTDTIVLNLFDSTAVRAVLTGTGGILAGSIRGKTIIDTSTNHFSEVLEFHELVARAGGTYLETPVLGSVVPASQGTLTILVSGDQHAYSEALGILQKFGKTIFYLGEPGRATKMKLVNNLVLGSFMTTLAEALALGEAAGVARDRILEILSAGAGNSVVLNGKKEKLLREDFTPQFSCAAIQKDLRYIEDLARQLGCRLTMGPAAAELFSQAVSSGLEQLDFSSVYKMLKEDNIPRR